jgi:hypothetical protein
MNRAVMSTRIRGSRAITASRADFLDNDAWNAYALEEASSESRAYAQAYIDKEHVLFFWRYRTCGKSCSGCPHGPYLFVRWYENGQRMEAYLGR